MSLLSVENLNVSIGAVPILHDVSLTIEPGQIAAVTGESGSGKSMTALSVMRLLPVRAGVTGKIRLGETELLPLSEPDMCAIRGNDIGMVFQEPMTALNPVQPIGAQVMETILIHDAMPRSQARNRTREVLDRVGLTGIPLTRYPHELSGGQRQRVVIAMAIALRPRLLIADEPTTALDVTTQATILELLKGLVADFGMGLLMITHDLAVVSEFADQLSIMKSGRIVEQGDTDAVMRDMQHPYTRALFKASGHQVKLPEIRTQTPLLDVQNVIRDYALPRTQLFARPRFHRAVDNVSFTINRGERVGLVGESGCGKSTLTRAILGLEPVQNGHIQLDGQPVSTNNPSMRRQMQVVFQDPFGSFNPRHRVDRLITEPFHLLLDPPNGAERDTLIADTLAAVGLEPTDAQKYPHQFSGGQRQRLAIARALILRPDLIVFDEAVSALDVSVRATILDLLAELCRTHALTYLFISHDLSVVRSVTDRVLVMKAGKIVESGDTETVFNAPRHPYTQKLIAAAPTLPEFGTNPVNV